MNSQEVKALRTAEHRKVNGYAARQERRLEAVRSLRSEEELTDIDCRSYAEDYGDLSARMGASVNGIEDYFSQLVECQRASKCLEEITQRKASLSKAEQAARAATLAQQKAGALQELAA